MADVANSVPVHTAHFSVTLGRLPSVSPSGNNSLPWVGARESKVFLSLSPHTSDLLHLEGDK